MIYVEGILKNRCYKNREQGEHCKEQENLLSVHERQSLKNRGYLNSF